ncbi:MAG: hypothetical protein HKN20_12830 [Gemmatimonadetes bacterium]|nr:hypothetical protein [Gemmatimonadota bacterium]
MTVNNEFARFGILPNVTRGSNLEFRMRGLFYLVRSYRSELITKYRLPLAERWKAWRAGFSSMSWVIYDLAENNPEHYLSNRYSRRHLYRINGYYNPIVGNKLVLSRLLTGHGLPHPAVVSTIQGGRLTADGIPAGADMARTLAHTLERFPRQVFRPTWSGMGRGVFFLKHESGALTLNDVPVTIEEVCGLLSGLDHYMATAFVNQATYAKKIFPGSTNTLRILTLWDSESGKPFIAGVSHRFGSSRSAPLDNWHQGRGGICAAIDAGAGLLGKGVTLTSERRLAWHSSHPETGEPVENVSMPGLSHCIEGLLEAAGHFPFCPLIGWDVVLTDDGYSILEANTTPGMWVWQVHTPLLIDPRTRRCFERWGLRR